MVNKDTIEFTIKENLILLELDCVELELHPLEVAESQSPGQVNNLEQCCLHASFQAVYL